MDRRWMGRDRLAIGRRAWTWAEPCRGPGIQRRRGRERVEFRSVGWGEACGAGRTGAGERIWTGVDSSVTWTKLNARKSFYLLQRRLITSTFIERVDNFELDKILR